MLALFGLFLLLPAVLPWIGGYTYLGTEVMIWMIFALGYNLLLGYTGLPAFGHGAFFGMAGYFLGMSQKWWTGGLWLPILAGILGTALCGAVVACFVARKRGIYFALLTIAFGVMFWFLVFVLDTWTGGEDGLTGINRLAVTLPGLGPVALRDNTAFYYFVYAFFVAATVLLWRIVNSPFGQVIRAIKQSETRARAVGYDTALYKWAVFTLSTAFAGLAGGLYTLARYGAFAEPMSLQQSGNVVLMCLIGGGFASFYGPALGVVVFLVLRDVFSTLTDHWMLLYGVLFMGIILFLPEGIMGLVQRVRPPAGFHDTRAAEAARAGDMPVEGPPR
jgi:branched-chain amino acid transport system permease protein